MKQSLKLFKESLDYFPGGVNSPVRAFNGVGGSPPFIEAAKGAHLWDADGKKYIDYVGGWGPAILGHAHPNVLNALQNAAQKGFSFGAPTGLELKLAKLVREAFPSMESLRFVNSGTEATMSAIRLARGFTNRDKIIKFEGCYHGHADYLLVKAGSGAATFGVPTSAGVPADFAKHTLSAPYNDLCTASMLMEQNRGDVAAIILEPIVGNNGVILPKEEFLPGLRKLCDDHGTLLIFDEVMTGFRVALGGAQSIYNVRADLTCLGKVIGGGLPVGAYGGRKDVMKKIAPLGEVYQAGTLSGNPLAMSAGIATLEELFKEGIYSSLKEKTQKLALGIKKRAEQNNIDLEVVCICGMFHLRFAQDSVESFKKFFHCCLAKGIYLPPSAFESCFVSLAHSEEDIEKTLEVIGRSFSA